MNEQPEKSKKAAQILIEFLRTLHLFLYDTGCWQELLKYAKCAVDVACPLVNDLSITADMNYILGMSYENMNRFTEAESLYDSSLQLMTDLEDKKGMGPVLHQLGILA
jgi:tetratricopeptide (TPR) repeat protein